MCSTHGKQASKSGWCVSESGVMGHIAAVVYMHSTHLNSGRIPVRQDCRQPAILLDKLGAAGDAPVAIVKEGVRSRRPSGDVACPHERVRTHTGFATGRYTRVFVSAGFESRDTYTENTSSSSSSLLTLSAAG